MLTLKEHIQYWVESAENDLSVADVLFNSGKYDWCLFIGHLVIEKILKALFVQKNNELTPPKIHNLLKLAQLSDIKLDKEQQLFLEIVNNFNIEGRYPEIKNEFYKTANKEFTNIHYSKIKEYYHWLKSQIK